MFKSTDIRIEPFGLVEVPTRLLIGLYRSPANICLQLVDWKTGEPWCKATANLSIPITQPHHVAIKNYGENEGVYEALVRDHVIVDNVIDWHMPDYSWVELPVVRLTPWVTDMPAYREVVALQADIPITPIFGKVAP